MERLDIAQLNQQAGYATGLNSARSALNLLSEQATASTRQLAEIIASDQVTGGNEFGLSAPVIGYRYELDSSRNFLDGRGYNIDKMAEATAAGGEDAGVFAPLKKVQEALKEDPSLRQMFYISKDSAGGGGDLHSGRHYGYLFTIERKPKTGEEYIAASAIEIKGTEEELQAIMNNLSGSRGTSTDAIIGFDRDAALTVDAITDLILESYNPDSPALKDENFARRMMDFKEGGLERFQELQELRIEELTEFFERFLQSVPGEQIAEALEFIATYAGGISTALFELKTEEEKAALFRIAGEFFEQEQTGVLWHADVRKEDITVPESNVSLTFTAEGAPVIRLERSKETHHAPVVYEFPLLSLPRREHPLARTPEKKSAGSLIARERPVGPYIEAAASKKIKTEKESDQFASLLAAAEELKRRAEEKAKLLTPALTLSDQNILPLSSASVSEKISVRETAQELKTASRLDIKEAPTAAAVSLATGAPVEEIKLKNDSESLKFSLKEKTTNRQQAAETIKDKVAISNSSKTIASPAISESHSDKLKVTNGAVSIKTSLQERTTISQQTEDAIKAKEAINGSRETLASSTSSETLAHSSFRKIEAANGEPLPVVRQKTVNAIPEIKTEALLEKQTSQLILKHEQKLQQVIQSLVQKGLSMENVATILKEKQIPASRIKALMEAPAKLTTTAALNGTQMESAITDIFIASGAGKITSSRAAVDLLKTSTSLESVLEKVESFPFSETQLQSIKEKISSLYLEPERQFVTDVPPSPETNQKEIKVSAAAESEKLEVANPLQDISQKTIGEVITATLQEFGSSEVAAVELAGKLLSDSPTLNKITERLEEYPLTPQQLEQLRERLAEAADSSPAAIALVQEINLEDRLVEALLESGVSEKAASKIVKDILTVSNSAEEVLNQLENYPLSEDTLEALKAIVNESYSEQETAEQNKGPDSRHTSLVEALKGANVNEIAAEKIASDILKESDDLENVLELAGRYPFTAEQLNDLKEALIESYSQENSQSLQLRTELLPEEILYSILKQMDSLPAAPDKIADEILNDAHSVDKIVEGLKNYPLPAETLNRLQKEIEAAFTEDVIALLKVREITENAIIDEVVPQNLQPDKAYRNQKIEPDLPEGDGQKLKQVLNNSSATTPDGIEENKNNSGSNELSGDKIPVVSKEQPRDGILKAETVISEVAKESITLFLKLLGFREEEDLPEMTELLISLMNGLPEVEPRYKPSEEKTENHKFMSSISDIEDVFKKPRPGKDLKQKSISGQTDTVLEQDDGNGKLTDRLLLLKKALIRPDAKVPVEEIKALVTEEKITAVDLKLIIAALNSSEMETETEATPHPAEPEHGKEERKTRHNPLNRKLGRIEREKILEFFMNQYSDLIAILSNDARKKLLESEYLFDFEARLYALLKNTDLTAEQKTAILAALHAHDSSGDISGLLSVFAGTISGSNANSPHRILIGE